MKFITTSLLLLIAVASLAQCEDAFIADPGFEDNFLAPANEFAELGYWYQNDGAEISADEATIMCLGIYEDTGSFTFPSTTEQDFKAAAFLLSKGANLNVVSDLIARELSPEQVSLLNDMIQSATRYNVNGIEVVVTSVTTEKYMPDFAFLVQKMVKMENLDALFAIGRMENKIYVVARSRSNDVDVGKSLFNFFQLTVSIGVIFNNSSAVIFTWGLKIN